MLLEKKTTDNFNRYYKYKPIVGYQTAFVKVA